MARTKRSARGLTQQENTLANAAFNGLRRLWSEKAGGRLGRERGGKLGGFNDALALKGGELAVRESKKLFYNAACQIAFLQYADDAIRGSEASEYCGRQADYLLRRFSARGFAAPTFENGETASMHEQGLLLWALAKTLRAGFGKRNALRAACAELANGISNSVKPDGMPEWNAPDYFTPMTTALCLDSFIESEAAGLGEARQARVLAGALQKNFVAPVFLIKQRGALQNRVSFNNIAYPLHALSRYSVARKDQQTKKIVGKCADALIEAQGPLGQWWWTYDATGRVVQRYPVYSVHQDGMTPMALRAAGEALGDKQRQRFERCIAKSLRWVFGENELRASLVQENEGVIWRSINCPWLIAKAKRFLPFLPEVKFGVKKECRSYHLAWLLYAATLKRSQ